MSALILIPEPKNVRFGGGLSQSVFNPLVLGVVLVAGYLICTSSRKRAIVAFLAPAILIPYDQILMIGSLHFPMLRLLILFGLVRIFRDRSSAPKRRANGISVAVVALGVTTAISGVLLYPESTSVVYQLGNLLTAFGSYFLLRDLIRDEDDIKQVLRTFAYAALAVAVLMVYEQATGKNPYFRFLGGAQAETYGAVFERDGKFRATGCFQHPILAGTFGAMLLPLFVGWWHKDQKSRRIAVIGALSALIIPIAANSSTSLFALVGGIVGLCFWPLRRRMRIVRWAVVTSLVGLHIVMKAPVWHLISRVSLAQGSDSEHRYQLVNQCILHFGSWWMIGTKDYAGWGWDLWDLSNQYVAIADQSGLIPLLAFLTLFVFGFKYLGRARVGPSVKRAQQLFVWGFGSSLFANVVGFFGISYFDQTIVVWYALLAMIGTLYAQRFAKKTEVVAVTPQPAFDSAISELECEPTPPRLLDLVSKVHHSEPI